MTLPFIPSKKKLTVPEGDSPAPLVCALLAIALSQAAFGGNSPTVLQFPAQVSLVVLFTVQFVWIGYLYLKNKKASRSKNI